MRNKTETINGTEYSLGVLTRGQVRQIEKAGKVSASAETDMLVKFTLGYKNAKQLDELPMPDYVKITEWALKVNRLNGSAIDEAKKN